MLARGAHCRTKPKRQTIVKLAVGFRLRAVIQVAAHHVDIRVARVTLDIVGIILNRVGTVNPQDIIDALLVEHLAGQPPQPHILILSALVLAPPEPAARVLVPRPEQHRNTVAVGIAETSYHVGSQPYPFHKRVGQRLIGKDTAKRHAVGKVFRRAVRRRICAMPRHSVHAAPAVVRRHLLPHLVEPYPIRRMARALLNADKIPAYDGRIVARGRKHIRRICIMLPVSPEREVIHMPKRHPSRALHRFKPPQQAPSLRVGRLLPPCRQNADAQRNYKQCNPKSKSHSSKNIHCKYITTTFRCQ